MSDDLARIAVKPEAAPSDDGDAGGTRRRGLQINERSGFDHGLIIVLRLSFIAVVLIAWEYLPGIAWLRQRSAVFDPFFVSSPSEIFAKLLDLATGRNDSPFIWPYARKTLEAALTGTTLGLVVGAGLGITLSISDIASAVLRPFIVAANAVPRVALIPIIVTFLGITFTSVVVTVFVVVLFVAFFNAYEGARSVEAHVIENARILGATRMQIARCIRFPYALAWTFAALPLAVTFGLISVITTEVFTGYPGLGRLLQTSTETADASLTFAVVVVLGSLGVVLAMLAEAAKKHWLHWWPQS